MPPLQAAQVSDHEITGVTFDARMWLWTTPHAPAKWHFLTIDGEAGEAIAAHAAMRRLEFGTGRGFGSVKVRAQLGGSRWATSVFPSKTHAGYLLPVKAVVRKAEKLSLDDVVTVRLELL